MAIVFHIYHAARLGVPHVRVQMRTKKNHSISLRLLLIILGLVFVCLYILDFDLSIFTFPV